MRDQYTMTEFETLVGRRYDFFGVDGHEFKLGDIVWEAMEDGDDGLRSYMDSVQRKHSDGIFFDQRLARVELRKLEKVDGDQFQLVDVEDYHVWLHFGTDHSDCYYPFFLFRYEPKLRKQTSADDRKAPRKFKQGNDFTRLVGRQFRFYGVCNHEFKLNDAVWEALEDEDDGYRSCMDTVCRKNSDGIFFERPLARVIVRKASTIDGYQLVDSKNDHVWLEFGTEREDHYYPIFIFRYQTKMEVRQERRKALRQARSQSHKFQKT